MNFKKTISFILLLSASFSNLQCAEKGISECKECEDCEKYETKEKGHLFEESPLLFNLDIFSNEKRNYCHKIMQRMYDDYLLHYEDNELTSRYENNKLNSRYDKRYYDERYLDDFRLNLIDFLKSSDSRFNINENSAFSYLVIVLIDSHKCLNIKDSKFEENPDNISKLLDEWSSFLDTKLIFDATSHR